MNPDKLLNVAFFVSCFSLYCNALHCTQTWFKTLASCVEHKWAGFIPAEGGQLPAHSQCFLHLMATLRYTESPLQPSGRCRTCQPAPPADRKRTDDLQFPAIPYAGCLLCRISTHLFLVFLPHTQGEHSLEIWAGDGQQGSVSRDTLLISHQNHITELAVLPLLVKTLQQLCSYVHPAEHLQTQWHKAWSPFPIIFTVRGKRLPHFSNPVLSHYP